MNFTMVVKREVKQKPSWWKSKADEATEAPAAERPTTDAAE
jgi:hypothetical protein